MRVTHQMLQRNYLNRMENNLSQYTKSGDKISSNRAFSKAHENVTDAGKALRMRKLIASNERYQSTIRDVQGRTAAAEDGLRTVNSLMIKVEDLLIEGMNGTMTTEDREKIATEIDQYQGQIYQIMNSKFGDKYVFSSAGNSDGSAPFEAVDGALKYNGTYTDTMMKQADGTIVDDNGDPIPFNTPNYVDIGFGYAIKDGGVDPNTAFKDTYSGVECFGYGYSSNGSSLNAWSLLGEISTNLRNSNMTGLDDNLDALKESMGFMLTSITEIGARGVTLDNTLTNLQNEYINLVETDDKLENVDIAEEIVYNSSYETTWMVTLQMGSKLIPPSIFNYLS